jgi:glycosyltransferase involved in cell wall biosynthesis
MKAEVLVSPLHISVMEKSGSEFVWASLFRKSLRKYFKGKKIEFFSGYDEEKFAIDSTSSIKNALPPLSISNKTFLKFSLTYNMHNFFRIINKPKILWHFLPFSFGYTFNLGIIFRVGDKCIVGPIQPALTIPDAYSSNSNNKNILLSIILIFKNIFNYLSMTTLKKADLIFVCSDEQKREMTRIGISENKIKTIGFGIVILDRKKLFNKPNKIKFICLGRFTSRKNQIEIIEAINLLPENIVNKIEINFYGDGPLLKEIIRKCNDKTREVVHFMGEKPRNEILTFLCRSDVLLSTSMSEGYSQSALEAVGAGIALMSTPVGGFKEIIEEAGNGVIVDYDIKSLAKEIANLTSKPQLIKIYKDKSRSYAKSHTWDEQLKKMLYFVYKK